MNYFFSPVKTLKVALQTCMCSWPYNHCNNLWIWWTNCHVISEVLLQTIESTHHFSQTTSISALKMDIVPYNRKGTCSLRELWACNILYWYGKVHKLAFPDMRRLPLYLYPLIATLFKETEKMCLTVTMDMQNYCIS